MSDALLQELIDAGTPALLVAKVAAELARADERAQAAAVADRRSPAAVKQQRYRDGLKADGVTRRNGVTQTVTRYGLGNADPSLDKKAPHTPKKINPTPCVGEPPVHVRAEILRIAITVLIAGCQAAQPKPKARWPKDMPPPADVGDDQWIGFLDHRKAKRQALTPRAYQLLASKLAAHASDEWPPGRIIDHIVERGWLSFEPDWLTKTPRTRNGQRHHQDNRSGGWAPRPGMEGVEPASLDDDEPCYAARR